MRTLGPISIDGRVDEEAWAVAQPITEFFQTQPSEGDPISRPTDVRFLYDDDALYVGARLHDSDPVFTRLKKRDASFADTDLFAVYIDTYHDHKTAARFTTNPSAVKKDQSMNPDGSNGDTSWDPVWEVETEVTDQGWSVEMRIPFSQLRFSPADEQFWGLQVERRIRSLQEWAVFAFTPLLERGGVARYGHLDGIRGIQPGRPLELLPYVGGRAGFVHAPRSAEVDFENPFRDARDFGGQVGLDLKYRAGTNVVVDATVNPDFGQVEADPAVINLTAFETRYQERRPFFIEGSDLFEFQEGGTAGSTGQPPQLVYSRRIGRAPQGRVPSAAVFAEEPSATTILGAAKVTGRTDGGWSLGVLEAVTQQEATRWVDAFGARARAVVEPRTNYAVALLRRDFRGGATRVGVLSSAVNRTLAETGLEGGLLAAAYAGGVDFTHEWASRSWRFSSALAGSHVRGSSEALLGTQRSSSRYFQRPDAEHLGLDADARALSGYYAMADLNKQAGALQVKLAGAAISPGFEVNDLGFQSRADRLIVDTQLSYQQTVPGKVFRNWNVRGGPDGIWNFGGERVFTEVNLMGDWVFANWWGGGAQLRYNPAFADDRLTRGGPVARAPARYSARLSVATDRTQDKVLNASYDWTRDDAGSWTQGVSLDFVLVYRSNWEFNLGPRLTREHAVAQYVTPLADPLATATYGRRFVFAALDQTTFSLDARADVIFSPTLSFELYAQPFISAGDYGDLKEFRTPGTFDFLRYGTDVGTIESGEDGRYAVDPDGSGPATGFTVADRDFNHWSLLGNAVLRWEWRPGSTLYLVWQQSRTRELTAGDPGVSGAGEFDFGKDAGELFRIQPDNILQIKVSYWLNP